MKLFMIILVAILLSTMAGQAQAQTPAPTPSSYTARAAAVGPVACDLNYRACSQAAADLNAARRGSRPRRGWRR